MISATSAIASFSTCNSSGGSQAHYISAGSSAPTYTWATTQPILSQDQNQQQLQQLQQQQLQKQQVPTSTDSSIKVTIPDASNSESPGPLTPVRHAPPPPEQDQLPPSSTPSFQNGHQFKTDIPAADDLIPIQNHHPLHPHVHQKDQVQQQAYFQHGSFLDYFCH